MEIKNRYTAEYSPDIYKTVDFLDWSMTHILAYWTGTSKSNPNFYRDQNELLMNIFRELIQKNCF